MSLNPPLNRRRLLQGSAALAFLSSHTGWSQTVKPGFTARAPAVVQIADMSPSQIDVSKDFLVGSRAAWAEINAKGGLRGRQVVHQTLEVDGTAASLKAALDSIKLQNQVVALVGTVGDRAAAQAVTYLRRDMPELPHLAPWLQNSRLELGDSTFTVFASRQEQIAHAIKSLSVMGITEIGAVYATPSELALYRDDMELTAAALNLRLKTYGPVGDLQQLGRTLNAQSPRILIFLGGTPELFQLSLGIDQLAVQRYIVAMSDVNLQTLQQMQVSRHTSVIATQVVPMINSGAAVVKSYRDILGRLYDEPPTPQSLSGYIAARYAFEVMQNAEGPLTRSSVLQSAQRRSVVELGGFRIDPDSRRKFNAYVTQSMIGSDGRIVG